MTNELGKGTMQALVDKVLLTEVILDNMFKYFTFDELLKTRLVCKKWRKGSDLAIRLQDNFVHLSTEKEFEKLALKLNEFKRGSNTIMFNKFSIVFEMMSLESISVSSFFKDHGSIIAQLKVRFALTPDSINTLKSFKILFENQLLNLELLHIFGLPQHLWKAHDMFDEQKYDGTKQYLLPNLKTLGFFSVVGYPKEALCPLYINILKCVPNVKKLILNNAGYLNLIVEDAVSTKYNRLRSLISGLKELSTIHGNMKTQLSSGLSEACVPITSINTLNGLVNLSPKLIKLRLCLGNQVPKWAFDNLLRKVANTLQELELSDHYRRLSDDSRKIPSCNGEDYAPEISDLIFTKLKVIKVKETAFLFSASIGKLLEKSFPVLNLLKVRYNPNMLQTATWKEYQSHPLKSLVIDGIPPRWDCVLDLSVYKRAFPTLKSLKLNVPNNESLLQVYDNFPNLEELDILGAFTDEGISGIEQMWCDNVFRYVEQESVQTHEFEQYRIKPYIGVLKKLRKLKVVSNLSTISALYGFADLKNLRHLYVELSWLNEMPLRMIYVLPTLQLLPELVKLEISEAFIQQSEVIGLRQRNVRYIPDRKRYCI